MYRYFFDGLLIVVVVVSILGCASVEPQRKDDSQTIPKVKEEDIIDNKSVGSPGPYTNGGPPYNLPGSVQPGNAHPSSPADPVTGKTPRRFIWKDKN